MIYPNEHYLFIYLFTINTNGGKIRLPGVLEGHSVFLKHENILHFAQTNTIQTLN